MLVRGVAAGVVPHDETARVGFSFRFVLLACPLCISEKVGGRVFREDGAGLSRTLMLTRTGRVGVQNCLVTSIEALVLNPTTPQYIMPEYVTGNYPQEGAVRLIAWDMQAKMTETFHRLLILPSINERVLRRKCGSRETAAAREMDVLARSLAL
jgi:hypothetical protein